MLILSLQGSVKGQLSRPQVLAHSLHHYHKALNLSES